MPTNLCYDSRNHIRELRCFKERHTARTVPLTLLAGENSEGKTSFPALVQVLLDITFNLANAGIPNFKKDPYDPGTFDEIAHYRGGRAGRAHTFRAGFCMDHVGSASARKIAKNDRGRIDIEFGRGPSAVPVPIGWHLSRQNTCIKMHLDDADSPFAHLSFGTSRGS